ARKGNEENYRKQSRYFQLPKRHLFVGNTFCKWSGFSKEVDEEVSHKLSVAVIHLWK
ncbi:MAG: hypothetical protein ACI81T_003956, partial [Bacteroidia bacterium]